VIVAQTCKADARENWVGVAPPSCNRPTRVGGHGGRWEKGKVSVHVTSKSAARTDAAGRRAHRGGGHARTCEVVRKWHARASSRLATEALAKARTRHRVDSDACDAGRAAGIMRWCGVAADHADHGQARMD
jgi:hypothetical protein